MNKFKWISIIPVSFCVISLLCVFTPIPALAGEYIGDFCWAFSHLALDISGVIKLGISHMGGDHYTCSGVITVTNPTFMQFPAYGNAELLAGKIYITLSLAGIRNGVIGIDMIKATLNPDLSGTFESIGVYADAVELSEGGLTSTTCQ
ncbi:MAG: hypothetical protein HY788_16950 [Deltaproteobacteria bacterium]|nr:hypothetical protein [Deltaproteobacteria bacterium]